MDGYSLWLKVKYLKIPVEQNRCATVQRVVEYFASFDEHIKDFRIEKVPHDGETKEDTYKINALHKMIDSDDMAEIPLGMESAGTLKMFALYPELLYDWKVWCNPYS